VNSVDAIDAEEILWTGHPSNWHYFWAWVLGILLAVVLVGFGIILWIVIDRSRRTYTVTSSRVIIEQGLWAKNSDEVRLMDIRSMAVKKSFISGLVGVGNIEFSSAAAADAEIVFRSVAGVEAVRDLVRAQQKA
jgi:uncharacterized membrane protein YdbT with pleckstrin-like domain